MRSIIGAALPSNDPFGNAHTAKLAFTAETNTLSVANPLLRAKRRTLALFWVVYPFSPIAPAPPSLFCSPELCRGALTLAGVPVVTRSGGFAMRLNKNEVPGRTMIAHFIPQQHRSDAVPCTQLRGLRRYHVAARRRVMHRPDDAAWLAEKSAA
jgi:hypothetical protein